MTDNSTSSTSSVFKTIANLDLPYEEIEIDPDLADTALFCERYGFPMKQSGNTIIVASKKEPKLFVACVVLANTRLDVNKRVRKLMGVSKASFASAEEMKVLTGMEVLGVTPFSLPEELQIYVDSLIMELDWVILGGGRRDRKLKITPKGFHQLSATNVKNLPLPFIFIVHGQDKNSPFSVFFPDSVRATDNKRFSGN